jgi:hypothetical protein
MRRVRNTILWVQLRTSERPAYTTLQQHSVHLTSRRPKSFTRFLRMMIDNYLSLSKPLGNFSHRGDLNLYGKNYVLNPEGVPLLVTQEILFDACWQGSYVSLDTSE